MQVDIKEAAHRLGKSEKTLRRWAHEGKMPAHLEEGRLMFAVSDIEAHQVAPSDRQRIETLEYHITELETRLRTLERLYELEHQKPTHARKTTPRPLQPQKQGLERALPDSLVGWRAFARLHNIGESTVQAAIETKKLEIVRGSWVVGHAPVRGALDAAGRARFYELYHDKRNKNGELQFKRCPDCPHML